MTAMNRARLSLSLRAWVGVVAIGLVAIFAIFNPIAVFTWMEGHKFLDGVIAVGAAVFHVWNTYHRNLVIP